LLNTGRPKSRYTVTNTTVILLRWHWLFIYWARDVPNWEMLRPLQGSGLKHSVSVSKLSVYSIQDKFHTNGLTTRQHDSGVMVHCRNSECKQTPFHEMCLLYWLNYENMCSNLSWNACNCFPVNTVLHLRTLESSSVSVWEPRILHHDFRFTEIKDSFGKNS
jgi:hypothetical protein